MSKWKIGVLVVFVFILLMALGFGLDVLHIQSQRITEPMREDVRREVFEETQSYVHGKRQELARAYSQWVQEDSEGRAAIESVVKITFADFPADQINSLDLRDWLVDVRGY